MLNVNVAGSNTIINSNLSGYIIYRRVNMGEWVNWNGSSWGGSALRISGNFTDYNLSTGSYAYKIIKDDFEDYSPCVVVGGHKVGWTFGNYTPPEGSFGEILTPDDMIFTYFFGIDPLATNGQTWTPEQSRSLIDWSVYEVEKQLNIDIYQRDNYADDDVNAGIDQDEFVRKEYPYKAIKRRQFITLKHRPVLDVSKFDFYTASDKKIFDLLPWMRLDRHSGRVHWQAKDSSLLGFWAMFNRMTTTFTFENGYHLNYKSGFKNAGLWGNTEARELRDVIGKICALKMLNAIGDGLLAGFSSSGVSIDGISENFSSTQSATSAYFGARIVQYEKTVKDFFRNNKHKYGNYAYGAI